MPEYRVYAMSQQGLFNAPPILMDVETDAEALLRALHSVQAQAGGAEVWLGTRLICRVPKSGWTTRRGGPASDGVGPAAVAEALASGAHPSAG